MTLILTFTVSLYLLLEVQSVLLAVKSLTSQLSFDELVKLESIAYATAGIGFTLFFLVQGYHLWFERKKKRYLITPLLLSPIIFVLGQVVSISFVENAPNALTNTQKGVALKSAMMLKQGHTDSIAPFFLDRNNVEAHSDKDLAHSYFRTLTQYEAQAQLLAAIQFVREIGSVYKHSQPTDFELKIYRSKLMVDFLDSSKYAPFDVEGINNYLSYNPIEPNPLLDVTNDIHTFFLLSDLNTEQKLELSKLLISHKANQYSALVNGVTLDYPMVDISHHFDQNQGMNISEYTHLLTSGFGVNEKVAKEVAKNGVYYSLDYGMTNKIFSSIIPSYFKFTPLSTGLTQEQFMAHEFTSEVISINMPILEFEGIEFIPVRKLASADYAESLSASIRQGLSDKAMQKAKLMNAKIATEMFDGGVYWDGLWAKESTIKKLVSSISVPIIIGVSTLLILMNVCGVLSLAGFNYKAQIGVSAAFVILILIVDLKTASQLYDLHLSEQLGWLHTGLSSIGMKPSQTY